MMGPFLSCGEPPDTPVLLLRKCILSCYKWEQQQHCSFFFKKSFLCMVFCLHICLCVCVPHAHSLQSQKVLHTSCRFPDTLNRDSGKSPAPTLLFAIPQCLTNRTSHYCQLWSVVLGVQWRRTLPPGPRAVPRPGNSDGHGRNRTESAREEEDSQSIKSSPTKA